MDGCVHRDDMVDKVGTNGCCKKSVSIPGWPPEGGGRMGDAVLVVE